MSERTAPGSNPGSHRLRGGSCSGSCWGPRFAECPGAQDPRPQPRGPGRAPQVRPGPCSAGAPDARDVRRFLRSLSAGPRPAPPAPPLPPGAGRQDGRAGASALSAPGAFGLEAGGPRPAPARPCFLRKGVQRAVPCQSLGLSCREGGSWAPAGWAGGVWVQAQLPPPTSWSGSWALRASVAGRPCHGACGGKPGRMDAGCAAEARGAERAEGKPRCGFGAGAQPAPTREGQRQGPAPLRVRWPAGPRRLPEDVPQTRREPRGGGAAGLAGRLLLSGSRPAAQAPRKPLPWTGTCARRSWVEFYLDSSSVLRVCGSRSRGDPSPDLGSPRVLRAQGGHSAARPRSLPWKEPGAGAGLCPPRSCRESGVPPGRRVWMSLGFLGPRNVSASEARRDFPHNLRVAPWQVFFLFFSILYLIDFSSSELCLSL